LSLEIQRAANNVVELSPEEEEKLREEEFCRSRNVTDFCRERYPDIFQMAMWVSRNEAMLESNSLFADEVDEINCQNDNMLSFELSSVADLILFLDISRERGLLVRAFSDQNPFPVPEDD